MEKKKGRSSRVKTKNISVDSVYGYYLTLILSEKKKSQFLEMEQELKKIVDRLLPLELHTLQSVTFDFYALAGSTKVCIYHDSHPISDSTDFYRNSIVNIIYSCTPLITYLYR